MSLFDLNVTLSEYVPEWHTRREQFRVPRSKRRRIRKKWAKQMSNWRFVSTGKRNIVETRSGGLYMHPNTWQAVKAKLGET